MNYIDKVTIDNFWGDKKVRIKFGTNENFLIGVNGSGKTIIINLIASVLEADFRTLDSTQFEKISIFLKPVNKNEGRTRLVVTKVENKKTHYPNILYSIYRGNLNVFEIYLDDLAEERIYRNNDFEYERFFRLRRKEQMHQKDLKSLLNTLFNTTWLSIHRANFNLRSRDERSRDSMVDLKLRDFSRNFTGYFNELNREAKLETDEFQKYLFLSLITTESKTQIYQTLESINLKKEKNHLAEVYNLFNLDKKDYESKLDDYANSYIESFKKRKNETLTFSDAEYLIGMKRIHSVVQKWQELLDKQKFIFRYKDNFISIINNLLQRKKILVNERNELMVETQSGKRFDLKFLSSGEKQLLIIFGETLLQKSEPYIFIADEPELSLHIEWQETLVASLKLLNPKAQMIFATHSPDVVGNFQKSIIKIENCIK